jgi:hypothetical protein
MLKTMMRAEPGALAEAKAFLGRAFGQSPAELKAEAIPTLLRLMDRPETKAAIAAFTEGGTPSWFLKYRPQTSPFWRKDV